MTFGTKLRLFRKLRARSFEFVAIGTILLPIGWYIDPDGAKILAVLFLCVAIWAVITAWLQYKIVLAAVKDGVRVGATVRGTELRHQGDDSPDLYVVNWRDDDGYLGESLPAPLKAFSDVTEGDRIFIYRNELSESWWERDIFGPVIRGNNTP